MAQYFKHDLPSFLALALAGGISHAQDHLEAEKLFGALTCDAKVPRPYGCRKQ
jgi:hypothetical protein